MRSCNIKREKEKKRNATNSHTFVQKNAPSCVLYKRGKKFHTGRKNGMYAYRKPSSPCSPLSAKKIQHVVGMCVFFSSCHRIYIKGV